MLTCCIVHTLVRHDYTYLIVRYLLLLILFKLLCRLFARCLRMLLMKQIRSKYKGHSHCHSHYATIQYAHIKCASLNWVWTESWNIWIVWNNNTVLSCSSYLRNTVLCLPIHLQDTSVSISPLNCKSQP